MVFAANNRAYFTCDFPVLSGVFSEVIQALGNQFNTQLNIPHITLLTIVFNQAQDETIKRIFNNPRFADPIKKAISFFHDANVTITDSNDYQIMGARNGFGGYIAKVYKTNDVFRDALHKFRMVFYTEFRARVASILKKRPEDVIEKCRRITYQSKDYYVYSYDSVDYFAIPAYDHGTATYTMHMSICKVEDSKFQTIDEVRKIAQPVFDRADSTVRFNASTFKADDSKGLYKPF